MKPYLFLSGLLLGTSISMSSLADTHVVDGSCNDARYGACTSTPPAITDTRVLYATSLLGKVVGGIVAIPVCVIGGLDPEFTVCEEALWNAVTGRF